MGEFLRSHFKNDFCLAYGIPLTSLDDVVFKDGRWASKRNKFFVKTITFFSRLNSFCQNPMQPQNALRKHAQYELY